MDDTGVVRQRDLLEAKYKRIIENTIRECNRVLDIWTDSQIKPTYQCQISVLRSYLSKFIRHEFNCRTVFKISNYNALCSVVNNRIERISFNNTYHFGGYVSEMNGLIEYASNFDYEKFYLTYRPAVRVKSMFADEVKDLEDISFHSIENIKF